MRRIGLALATAATVLAAVVGAGFLLIESGEVIVLRTTHARGDEFVARLWVVDHAGQPWVGKMDPSEARWVGRLREEQAVELVRGGDRSCRRPVFVADSGTRLALYALYLEKYRVPLYGARLLGLILGGNPDPVESAESAVLVRLDTCASVQ